MYYTIYYTCIYGHIQCSLHKTKKIHHFRNNFFLLLILSRDTNTQIIPAIAHQFSVRK